MPITRIYKVDFRHEGGRSIANMRLEAEDKRMAEETSRKIAAAIGAIMTDHYEKWIGYRKEQKIATIVELEPGNNGH